MKKLLLFPFVIGIVFFVSCEEKELTSLDGTRWKEREEYNGQWSQIELTFTSTHVTCVDSNSANNNSGFTGTYTFDPPVIEIVSDHWTFWGEPPEGTIEFHNRHKGTVSGKTMRIDIACGDEVMQCELKRQ